MNPCGLPAYPRSRGPALEALRPSAFAPGARTGLPPCGFRLPVPLAGNVPPFATHARFAGSNQEGGRSRAARGLSVTLQKAELKKKTQLAQRNEKPSRLNEGMQKIIRDVHEIADAIEGSTWRIQRKARANGRWATLKGSYWNEAQAEDALADLPNKKGSWWRIVEVKSEVED